MATPGSKHTGTLLYYCKHQTTSNNSSGNVLAICPANISAMPHQPGVFFMLYAFTWASNFPALCRKVMQIPCKPRISQELFSKHSNTPHPTSPALTKQCWISAKMKKKITSFLPC